MRYACAGLGLVGLVLSVAPAYAQDEAIPTDGLELWVKADGPMKVANGQISEWTDLSAKANNAIHDAFGQATPTVATANGQPTLRWSGVYSGFHFTKITTIRTVFAVLSKVSTSCLPTLPNYGTSAKFWIGGAALPTFFHPEHGCCIYNSNLSEVSPNLVNGKTYVNGTSVDGRTTQFPLDKLGLLSIVALDNVSADTIGRDRTFQDRSWQGDISELIIYSKALDDATRVSIENILTKKYAIGGGSADGGVVDAGAGGAGGAGGRSGADAAAGRGGAGGSTGAGGSASSGGSVSGGGSTSDGGSVASGGSTSVGGSASATGGTTTTAGGASAAGGTTATVGGALGSGGASVLTGTGGVSAGGSVSTSQASGGAPAGGTTGDTRTNVGSKSSGCRYAVGRRDDGRLSDLLALLAVALSSLFLIRFRPAAKA